MTEKIMTMKVTDTERRLIELLRQLGYGEMIVTVEQGRPTEINETRQSLMLDR